ncbi:copper-binding protein [uncultured Paludibaculum sp.]|uniref:copper-binding protein n=1 Tax=uncultured Paludibaculum sp. TaxID=1765020 RepID=UPI002AAAE043|nr:copper-binding protein [uncultured Paludibaculum sp.]
MNRRSFGLAALAAVCAACAKKGENRFDYGEAKKKYELKGVVVSVKPEDRVVTVKHEKIGDWMEAMTMDFPVPSAEEFAKLKPGLAIKATVNVNDMFFWLTGVTVE